MKNASEIMYKIGKIINIIMIPVSVLLIVIGAVLIATTPVSTEMTPEELQKIASASTCIGYGVYFLITSVLSIIICPKKHKEIANGNMEIAPRVFLIVFGAIADNIFYVLAGIFSLVARSQELNSNSSNTSSEE
ncbi:MAG: hypothetical protein IJS83_06800 [Acholeplasmatales bacterium]|nr:hypothetical protein [Acholeplasmatales bacterium]